MKKLFAVLMAIALVFSMGTIAFAADTGTITIENAVEGVTYKIYRILDFTPVNGDDSQGIYTIAHGWDTFFGGSNPDVANAFEVSENNGKDVVTLKKDATVNQAIAKAAINYTVGQNITAVAEKKADNTGKVEFTGLPLGYYAIDTSLGTLCALTNTNSDFTAVEKNEKPDLVKKIVEGDALVDANNVKIGDTVTYQATIKIGVGAQNYVMHDKMSETLEYTGVTSVKVDGVDVDTDNYTVVVDPEDDDCTFDIVFENSYTSTLEKGTKIVVTYTAELLDTAKVGAEGNPNEAWLDYGDDQHSNHDFVITYTTKYTVEKVDANGNPLAGAGFTLYKMNAGSWEKVGEEQFIDSLADGEEAIYEWIGLEEGMYRLEETTVPEGYNKAAYIDFTIECDEPENVTLGTETADWTVDDGTTEGEDPIVVEEADTFKTTVVNKTGSLLPETGGIGTTIFYVVGGLLMVAAFVVLVSKKRMKSVA